MNQAVVAQVSKPAVSHSTAPTTRTWKLIESFSIDPAMDGWKQHGESSLFKWNAQQQELEVIWDSSKPNSYFYHRLPFTLNKADDFSLSLDMSISEIQAGNNPLQPFAFEIALGFFNEAQSTSTNFLRGTGVNSPDLVEWDYFPDTGFGATIWPVAIDASSVFNYNGANDFTLLTLKPGSLYHIEYTFRSGNHSIEVIMTEDGQPFGPINKVPLADSFTDFAIDSVGICSYNDQQSGGSVFARATIDNVSVTTPKPPVDKIRQRSSTSVREIEFVSQPGWRYQLERSSTLTSWESVGADIPGTGDLLFLVDPKPETTPLFYRVKAIRP